MLLTSDETTCVCVCVCVVLVVIAALVTVVTDCANFCFGGLGRRSSGGRAGDDDGHGDDAPACVGGVCWAVSAADVRLDADRALSCFDTWLRRREVDVCFDGLRGASWWWWPLRCCRTGGCVP